MTKDEIFQVLLDKSIVVLIGDQYFLTEKYKEVLDNPVIIKKPEVIEEVKPAIDINALHDTSTAGFGWPSQIIDQTGVARASALMDACEIPSMAPNGAYRLRGLDKDAINLVSNFVDNDEISPTDFIQAIKNYYQNTELPKGFKKLLLEGDAYSIYVEYMQGDIGNTPKTNGSWG